MRHDATMPPRPTHGRLAGKVALVCGGGHTPVPSLAPAASQGLMGNGAAMARLFAREGATVVVLDIDGAAAQRTVDLIATDGHSASAVVADVTQAGPLRAAVEQVLAGHGRIDVLVNNVGTTRMGGVIGESEDDWDHVMATNLRGIFLACKFVLPGMIERGAGAVVNTSSLAGLRHTGYPYAGYYASKGGVNQLTVGIALQHAHQGIRVNAIAPGPMHTPLIFTQISGQYQDVEAMVAARHAMSPTGRMGTAWDIAHAALFLASDEARYVNGVTLPVDGGIHGACPSLVRAAG